MDCFAQLIASSAVESTARNCRSADHAKAWVEYALEERQVQALKASFQRSGV